MNVFHLTDRQLARIETDFAVVPVDLNNVRELMLKCTEEEAVCLKFLYAYMPASDIVSYPAEFFLEHVRQTLEIRQKLSRGEKAEGMTFLQDVLSIRINNENLVLFKKQLFDALYPRVKGLTMREAILEVNYWCYEHATYNSTDIRTNNAMSVLRRAGGRCGEESMLTVSALRSVGIPARQCYAPRWSACDDNHAWVEALAEDGWHSIGACEPEPVLDRGWYIPAATKAMLVHQRIFSGQMEDPEMILQTPVFAEVNILDHYAKTRLLTVRVEDESGNPAEGAEVQFQIINYAELYPLATTFTNKDGVVLFRTGLASIWVQVVWNGKILAQKAEFDQNELIFRMGEAAEREHGVWQMDLEVPPASETPDTSYSGEMAAHHQQRMDFADRCRNGYRDTFYTGEKAKEEATKYPCRQEEIARFLECSTGNYREILAFLNSDSGLPFEDRVDILSTLSEKDFSDITADLLERHLRLALPFRENYPREIFMPYVLSPRVAFEMIVNYREELLKLIPKADQKAFAENPDHLYEEICTSVRDCGSREYALLYADPAGLWQWKYGSKRSRDFLFAAVCRTLGVPARFRKLDDRPEYWKDGEWHSVYEPDEAKPECGVLLLKKEKETDELANHRTFSLARWYRGKYQTLEPELCWENGCCRLCLEAGDYRVITANRQTDGSICAELTAFTLHAGEEQDVLLRLRSRAADAVKAIKLPELLCRESDGTVKPLTALLPAGIRSAVAFIEVGREPTEHLLNEILEQPERFASQAERMLLLCREENQLSDPLLQKALAASGIRVMFWAENAPELAAAALELSEIKLPLILFLNKEGNCVFQMSGYNVGTGDRILSHLK